MSHIIAPASSFRTPFDFSVGGSIVQNSTQLSQLRDRYTRESHALTLQQQTSDTIRHIERERYMASLNALRSRSAHIEDRVAAKEAYRAAQRALERKRDASVHTSLPRSDLLPFSSHCQRMPPSLIKGGKKNGIQKAKFTSTWQGGPSERLSAPKPEPPSATYQFAGADAVYLRHPKGIPGQHQQPAQLRRSNSTTQAYTMMPFEPSSTHPQQSHPPSNYPHPSHDDTNSFAHTHPSAYSVSSSFDPSSSSYSGVSYGPSRPAYGLRTSPLREVDQPLQTFHVPQVDTAIDLPFTHEDLLQLGHKVSQHPFYKHDQRFVNHEDQAFQTLLEQRYPKDHLQPPPAAAAGARSIEATKLLPHDYNLNRWSIDFSKGVKKCRETKIAEELYAKKYL